MVVQLYHIPGSPPCRAVYMIVKELGLPVEVKLINSMEKDHLKPEFLKINPEHKLPTIVDGDFILWESRAIMRYLVDMYGGKDNSLYPKDLQKRALVNRLLDFDLGFFYRYTLDDRMAAFKKEKNGEAQKKVREAYEWLDKQVKDRKYVAGNDLTIADFAMVVSFMMCDNADDVASLASSYPHAWAWYKRMQALSYYTECNKPFFDFLEKLKTGEIDMNKKD